MLMRGQLYSNLDDSVENRANILLGVILFDDERPTLTGSVLSEDPDANESFVRVFDARGNVTFNNRVFEGDAPVDERAVERALAGGPYHTDGKRG